MTETISIELPRSLVVKLDGATNNRTDFVCEAVKDKLRRVRPKGLSTWDALERAAGLDVDVPVAREDVKRVDL